MADREEFHFVGTVVRSESKDVPTANGVREKLDVFAIGAGPDGNITQPRRISLWAMKKDGGEQSWLALLKGEIAKAVGLDRGEKATLRFSGTKTPAERGGFYYDGNKVEIFDPAVHGTSSGSAANGPSPASGGVQKAQVLGAWEPATVTIEDALRAAEILFPRIPKETTDTQTGEIRAMTPAEEKAWIATRIGTLLRMVRGIVVQVNSEPKPDPVRTNGEPPG